MKMQPNFEIGKHSANRLMSLIIQMCINLKNKLK